MGGVIPSWTVNAQTPTTSDLPATIGNESNSDLALTNNTLPVENATTVIPLSEVASYHSMELIKNLEDE